MLTKPQHKFNFILDIFVFNSKSRLYDPNIQQLKSHTQLTSQSVFHNSYCSLVQANNRMVDKVSNTLVCTAAAPSVT